MTQLDAVFIIGLLAGFMFGITFTLGLVSAFKGNFKL